ncbi:MAG: amidohydrolase family protein [Alphaproteobacteria bacterium]|nr:amidohydrolase family protein [Alphaproteobacteria bacterium]
MFKKISATQIFDGYQFLEPDTVIIVSKNGRIIDIVHQKDAGDDVLFEDGILTPGFINCHCHVELSYLYGKIPEHTGLPQFLSHISRLRSETENFEIQEKIKQADTTMYQNGIVAVGDICNQADSISIKATSNIHYYSFIETFDIRPQTSTINFKKALNVLQAFQTYHLKSSLVPHAPYSVSPQLFQLLLPYFKNNLVSIHNQETNSENEFTFNHSGALHQFFNSLHIEMNHLLKTGTSSLKSVLSFLNNSKTLILVHNTFTSLDDIKYAQNFHKNIFWCFNVNANLYIENTVPNLNQFIDQHVQIVLGTDSLASNHQLSIFEEIKTIQKYFPDTSLAQLLKFATINGAKALQMEDKLGSIEVGKTPGLNLLSLDTIKKII